MANKRLYWDAGHGGSDAGAVGNGLKEKDLAIKVTKYAHAYIKDNYVCDQYLDISDDNLNTITARANKWGADLVVSNHFNAYKPNVGDGYEGLVYNSKNIALGQMFEKYVKAVGQNSRGVKCRDDLAILRDTKCKAILNEIAFIDTKKDIKDWDEDKELKVMGQALAKAAADWLILPKKTVKYMTQGNMNFRKGATTASDVIGTIPKGTTINVQSVDKNGWGKLTYKNKTGYVRIKSSTTTYCKLV